jgi:GGDEF domain-containing protein
MADLTRKLHRQSDFDGVLATAALEVGTSWKTTRCVAAMRKPGHQPTAIQEFFASGTKAAESSSLARLAVVADDLAQKKQAVAVDDAFSAPELQAIHGIVKELNFISMLALPLSDGQAHVGVILLLQDAPREWNMNDVVVLKAIAEQIGLALNNAGLRRLVNNLSVTDEKSGLLSRSSYLDLLIGEVRRAQEENSPITLMLLQFGGPEFLKLQGQDVVESLMQHAGKLLASNIRQDDFAFRYEPATMALVLGATAEKHAELAVEKFRRLLQEVKMPDASDPVPFTAGIAEAVMRAQYDPIDIVTEVINRVEHALEQANSHGGNRVLVLSSLFTSAAVA